MPVSTALRSQSNCSGLRSFVADQDLPWEWLEGQPLLRNALNLVEAGHFSQGDRDLFRPLVENVVGRDRFALIADFGSYLQAQAAVDAHWADPCRWRRMALLNLARSGFFSSDRAIRTYATSIWNVHPCPVDMSCPINR